MIKNLLLTAILILIKHNVSFTQEIYLDPSKSIDLKVADLVGKMTLKEKVSQMSDASMAIPRLNIPEYHWWYEALHGGAHAGVATVFPLAIGYVPTSGSYFFLNYN